MNTNSDKKQNKLDEFAQSKASRIDEIFAAPKPKPDFSSPKEEIEKKKELENDIDEILEQYHSAEFNPQDGTFSIDLDEINNLNDPEIEKMFDRIDLEEGRGYMSYRTEGNQVGNDFKFLIKKMIASKSVDDTESRLSNVLDETNDLFEEMDNKSNVEYDPEHIENIKENQLEVDEPKEKPKNSINMSKKFR